MEVLFGQLIIVSLPLQHGDDILFAQAIWDYKSTDNEELSFVAGDLIDVTDTSHKEWWWGAIKSENESRYGWFPASYVRVSTNMFHSSMSTLIYSYFSNLPHFSSK